MPLQQIPTGAVDSHNSASINKRNFCDHCEKNQFARDSLFLGSDGGLARLGSICTIRMALPVKPRGMTVANTTQQNNKTLEQQTSHTPSSVLHCAALRCAVSCRATKATQTNQPLDRPANKPPNQRPHTTKHTKNNFRTTNTDNGLSIVSTQRRQCHQSVSSMKPAGKHNQLMHSKLTLNRLLTLVASFHLLFTSYLVAGS